LLPSNHASFSSTARQDVREGRIRGHRRTKNSETPISKSKDTLKALKESLLVEEQKSTEQNPPTSKKAATKKSPREEISVNAKSPQKKSAKTPSDDVDSATVSKGKKPIKKVSDKSTKASKPSKTTIRDKEPKPKAKRAKGTGSSTKVLASSNDGSGNPETTVKIRHFLSRKKAPLIARRVRSVRSNITSRNILVTKAESCVYDNESATADALAKIIEDGNLSETDTVRAVRNLRATLLKNDLVQGVPSRGFGNRTITAGMSIKDGMLKKPSRRRTPPATRPREKATPSKGSSRPATVRTGPMKGSGKPGFEVKSVVANDLSLTPVLKPQPQVPSLSYGLERVLFNPGVYHLQDPRSRVFNFDPYLAKIMPVSEFDFNALKQYITSSQDETLLTTARAEKKKYTGSTSSTTAALAHFHFLLSQWRPINTGTLSQSFPVEYHTFTALQRGPSAVFLRWRDGTYAIDADKQYDTANILSMLGKSMEKLLTLPMEDFEKYRKENSDQISEQEREEAEAFNYTTIGDFLLRSQLDAYDPRLPGTGMFDLKTRAVVSIRMDTKKYEEGMDYEILGRFGEFESFEREYYDMIRAAFLKYSLQVRMGRMDGIFVAFHNTQRIFGFQYVSLSEMDYALHGTADTTTGDSEFKLSLELLNRALDKATAKYPEKSLRLHFETRGDETPFMYIFAEPMEEEDIQKVQESNKAAVLEFEQNVLGLNTGKTEQEVLEEQKKAEWESLRAKVEESMEIDELNIQEARAIAEAMLEETGHLGHLSAKQKEKLMDELMATFEEDDAEGVEGTAAGIVDEEDAEEDGENEDESEDADNEDQDEDEEHEEEEEDTEKHEDEKDAEQGEEESHTDEIEQNDELEEREVRETESMDDSKNAVGVEEPGLDAQLHVDPVETLNVGLQVVGNEQLPADEAVESTDLETLQDENESDGLERAVHSIQEGSVKTEVESTGDDVLAMTLTIRNKVNGDYVVRPINLHKDDKWEVEYALAEVPQLERARLLYEATKRRRFQALSSAKKIQDNPWNSAYLQNLRNLSNKGRYWRQAQTKIDEAAGPPKVLDLKDSASKSSLWSEEKTKEKKE
jgi:hypothetical protein